MIYLPACRKTFTGVRYWRWVFRPVWTTTPKAGKCVARGRVRWFSTLRLKRATERGRGIRRPPFQASLDYGVAGFAIGAISGLVGDIYRPVNAEFVYEVADM